MGYGVGMAEKKDENAPTLYDSDNNDENLID